MTLIDYYEDMLDGRTFVACIFIHYMSADEREEFVSHLIDIFDAEGECINEYDYYDVCEFFGDKNILRELQQYLSSDKLNDLEDWIRKEYDYDED